MPRFFLRAIIRRSFKNKKMKPSGTNIRILGHCYMWKMLRKADPFLWRTDPIREVIKRSYSGNRLTPVTIQITLISSLSLSICSWSSALPAAAPPPPIPWGGVEKTNEVLTSTSARFLRLTVEETFVGVDSPWVGDIPGSWLKLSPTETGSNKTNWIHLWTSILWE